MSLVLTLASRNLLQDRLRFVASLTGIVFSVVLVMVQMGLYFGFNTMVTTMIDHASTDLWVISSGTKYFEDLSLINTRVGDRLRATDGVAEVVPIVAGFSAWSLPDSAMTSIFIVGSDVATGGLPPWNVVGGTVQSLATRGTVAIDQTYRDRLGGAGIGTATSIRGEPAKVGAMTDGIRSFTTTPYVFTGLTDARTYVGLPPVFTTHFLIRLKQGADLERVRQAVLSNNQAIQVLTPDQFREQSRAFWLFRTGAGAALVAGAVLGVIVGIVIVAQTLYASTKEHLNEFATLRAIGSPRGYIYRVIVCQAGVSAVLGYAIAAGAALLCVYFTAGSALPIVLTGWLMAAIFLLTVVMCVGSGIAAILKVMRVDPATAFTR